MLVNTRLPGFFFVIMGVSLAALFAVSAAPAQKKPTKYPRLVADEVLVESEQGLSIVRGRVRDREPGAPVLGSTETDAAARRLEALSEQAIAGGFYNLAYDNRDQKHSLLPPDRFPRLATIDNSSLPGGRRARRGVPQFIWPGYTVIGNASLAETAGRFPRSLPRALMTGRRNPLQAIRPYTANALYVYPAHKDFNGDDLFPANWPYAIASRGSSYSDMPIVDALVLAAAALPAHTRRALEAASLMGPTLQMLLRRNLTGIETLDDYLTGAAHPVVFDGKRVDALAMVEMASTMRPEAIPTQPTLNVISETFERDSDAGGRDERLFDTPAAVARLWRSHRAQQRVVLGPGQTSDPNGRALDYHWVLLRGDPEKVHIEPLGERGQRAEITIDWHEPEDIPPLGGARSARIEIGLIVTNGEFASAPAIFSVSMPHHQTRIYARGEDGARRLERIDYRAGALPSDPALDWQANWADVLDYDAGGQLTGWWRETRIGRCRFDAQGRLNGEIVPRYETRWRDGQRWLVATNLPVRCGGEPDRQPTADNES
ncbi:hypothetical protein V6X63_10100 [Spiribacter sp. 221]|uniref:hypothetical protein n=1 Tax=Spiribacter onubensis TaxID=3122420 RepID=UPI00349F87B7